MIGIPRSNSMGRIFQSMTNAADHLPSSEEAIRRGEYAVIRSLVRVLEVPDIKLDISCVRQEFVLVVLIC